MRPCMTRSWTAYDRRRRVPNSEKAMLCEMSCWAFALAISAEVRSTARQPVERDDKNVT
jgi:hypothetical protein